MNKQNRTMFKQEWFKDPLPLEEAMFRLEFENLVYEIIGDNPHILAKKMGWPINKATAFLQEAKDEQSVDILIFIEIMFKLGYRMKLTAVQLDKAGDEGTITKQISATVPSYSPPLVEL